MKQKILWHYYCSFKSSHCYLETYEIYVSWRNNTEIRTRISALGWDLIHSSVHEAKHQFGVDLAVQELAKVFLNGMSNPWNTWRSPSWLSSYRTKHQKSSHYVKRKHHRVKQVNAHEIAKRNWRKEKGIDKDKQKNGWRRRGAGRYFKRLSNKMHRSWEKEQIFREEYDSMHNIDYKYFLDPWMWD